MAERRAWGKVPAEGHGDRKWSQTRRNCKCGYNFLAEEEQDGHQPGVLLMTLPEENSRRQPGPVDTRCWGNWGAQARNEVGPDLAPFAKITRRWTGNLNTTKAKDS